MSKTIVFYGCPAFVCQVLGLRRAKVWLDWPDEAPLNYDSAKTLELDLDKSPSFGKGAVEVDDTISVPAGGTKGLTALGPRWPKSFRNGDGHASEAGVWLEESVWKNALDKGLMQYPPRYHRAGPLNSQQGTAMSELHRVYRWQSLLVPTTAPGPLPARRYHGFHARLEKLTDNMATFAVWPTTEDINTTNFRIKTVDLSNVAHVHDTDVVTAAGTWKRPREVGQPGPLFLGWDILGDLPSPKLPLGQLGPIPFPI